MKELTDKITAFLRENPKRAAALGAGICLCLAALIITIGLALSGGEEPDAPAVSIPDGAVSTSTWPKSDLLDGIAAPDAGKIVAVHETDRTVAVFLEDFPAESLQVYLDDTGLTFKGSAPYVATVDGKTVAVVYSASDERLSVTVIS